MASEMMSGKGGRRSGVDRRSKFITPNVDYTYSGAERRTGIERRSGNDRRLLADRRSFLERRFITSVVNLNTPRMFLKKG